MNTTGFILWGVFMIAFFVNFVLFTTLHIAQKDTGVEQCKLCVEDNREYKCECEKIFERDYNDLVGYIPWVWILLAIISIIIGR